MASLDNAVIVSDTMALERHAPVSPEVSTTVTVPTTAPVTIRDAEGRFVSAEPVMETPVEETSEQDVQPVETTTAGPARKKESPQKRIDREVWKRREAERQFEADRQRYEAVIAAIRAGSSSPVTSPTRAENVATPSPVDPNAEPTEDQFERYEDFVKAIARHTARMEHLAIQQERQREEADQKQKTAVQSALTEHQKRVELGRTMHADYDEVVMREDVDVSAAMQDAIVHSPLGHEVMYWLGTHADDAARIARMPPGPALVEMGRIEARLEAMASVPPQSRPVPQAPLTKTPPPITPISGSTHTTRTPLEALPLRDYIKRRNDEEAARAAR